MSEAGKFLRTIADMVEAMEQSEGDLIKAMHAAKHHDRLVEALENLEQVVRKATWDSQESAIMDWLDAATHMAREALSQAKGESNG